MVKVKICGITNEDDARAAVDAGADLLGFIFYPPSPRYVNSERARAILDSVADARPQLRAAGIFVNEPPEHVCAVLEQAGLDLAQLHGQELPDMVLMLGARAYKTLQAGDLDSAHALLERYRSVVGANSPAFIADAPPGNLPGGNGTVADWSVAREIAQAYPTLLAGGLTVENVSEAVVTVQPWGVDVSSGVERAPGLKDHARVREFIRRAKSL